MIKSIALILFSISLLACHSEDAPTKPEALSPESKVESVPTSSEVISKQKEFLAIFCACQDNACRKEAKSHAVTAFDQETLKRTAMELPVEFGELLAQKQACTPMPPRTPEAEAALDVTDDVITKLIDEMCACSDLDCFDKLDVQFDDRVDTKSMEDFTQFRAQRGGLLMAKHKKCRDALNAPGN